MLPTPVYGNRALVSAACCQCPGDRAGGRSRSPGLGRDALPGGCCLLAHSAHCVTAPTFPNTLSGCKVQHRVIIFFFFSDEYETFKKV